MTIYQLPRSHRMVGWFVNDGDIGEEIGHDGVNWTELPLLNTGSLTNVVLLTKLASISFSTRNVFHEFCVTQFHVGHAVA